MCECMMRACHALTHAHEPPFPGTATVVSPLKHQLSPPLKAAESPGSSTEEAPAVTGTARLCALDFPADILRESVFETVGGAAYSAAERLHGI